MRRRILSLLLAFAMVLGMMPTVAFASSDSENCPIQINVNGSAVNFSYTQTIDQYSHYVAQVSAGVPIEIVYANAVKGTRYELQSLGGILIDFTNTSYTISPEDFEAFVLSDEQKAYVNEDYEFLGEVDYSLDDGQWALIRLWDVEENWYHNVYLKIAEETTEAETFTVELTEGGLYEIYPYEDSVSPVAHGGSFSFSVSPVSGYHLNNATVFANSVPLEPVTKGTNYNTYTITNITENKIVTVEGVEKIIENQKTITAPSGAEVHVYHQNGYDKTTGNGNDKEIEPVKAVSNGDTVTYTYSVPSAGGIYVAFYDGKIPYAGYFNSVTDVVLSWEGETKTPGYRGSYDTSTDFGSYADDSVYTNVNSNGHLVLNNEFMLRAYRGWQIVNTTTNNVMIEPEFNYSTSNENITITPYNDREGNDRTVKASGTSSNNWVYLTPNGSGITYLEIGYDAVHIVDGFAAGGTEGAAGQPSNFTWNASDEERTALLVVQTDGNAASGIKFGIQSPSGGWDYEYDTVYFTESRGSITMKPTGDVATVSVSYNKGGSYQTITGNDGTYVVPIVPGNNIIRITDSNGKTAFQVVRGARCSYTVTNLTSEGQPVSVGDTVRVQFEGMHTVCPKISGVYNPGYMGTNKTNYTLNGSKFLVSAGYQYDYHNNVWVEFTAPNAQCVLTNGVMTTSPAMGSTIGALYQASAVNSSGTSSQDRNILPEIAIEIAGVHDAPATFVALNQQDVSLAVGGSILLTAVVEPEDTTDSLVWTSSDKAVATVDNGLVKAVAAGEATITATAGEVSASCKVTVTNQQAGDFTLETRLASDSPDPFEIGLSTIHITGPLPVGEISGDEGPDWSMNVAAGTGDAMTFTVTAVAGGGPAAAGKSKAWYFWIQDVRSENVVANCQNQTFTTTITPEWIDNVATVTFGMGAKSINKEAKYTITMTRVATEEEAETFTVTFPEEKTGYSIEIVEGENPVEEGGSLSFKVIPAEGYDAASLVVKANGTALDPADSNEHIYVLQDVSQDVEVTVDISEAAPETYTVTFTPDDGTYTITPVEGTQYPVPSGGDFSFTIIASEGYDVSNVNFVTNLGITPTYENDVYTICNIGQNVIVEVQNVQEASSGIEIMLPQDDRYTIEIVDGKYQAGDKGSILVEEGMTLVFTVKPAAGYEDATFTVSVDGEPLEAQDGAYVLEKIDKPKEILVTVTEATPQTYQVTMNSGTGYTLSKLAGYLTTVNAGGSFGFVAKVNAGYVKGENFAVTVNGITIDPQQDGTYLIENIQENQNISVVGVEPCATNTVDVYFSVSKYNDFITENGKTIALQKLTVPYFDLALYGLENVYYNPDCYAGGTKESQVGGTPEIANGKITALHLFIYATEVFCHNQAPENAGKGYLAQRAGGNWRDFYLQDNTPGSIFMNFWDLGIYNTYFQNYEYPLGRDNYGASADQIVLETGDIISVRYKNTNERDQGTFYHFGEEGDLSKTVKKGEQVALTLYKTAENYEEGSSTVHNVVTESCNVYVTAGSAPASHTGLTPVGTTQNGKITIDTSELLPDTIYYVTTNTHDPAVMMLEVEEGEQPPTEEEIEYGELDNDGELTVADAVELCRIINLVNENPTEEQLKAADVNRDGEIDIEDAVKLCRMINLEE